MFSFYFQCLFRFISNQRPFVFLKQQQSTMKMAGNVRTLYVTREREIRKIRASGPGCSGICRVEVCKSDPNPI